MVLVFKIHKSKPKTAETKFKVFKYFIIKIKFLKSYFKSIKKKWEKWETKHDNEQIIIHSLDRTLENLNFPKLILKSKSWMMKPIFQILKART